jgi:hypothetical protein
VLIFLSLAANFLFLVLPIYARVFFRPRTRKSFGILVLLFSFNLPELLLFQLYCSVMNFFAAIISSLELVHINPFYVY